MSKESNRQLNRVVAKHKTEDIMFESEDFISVFQKISETELAYYEFDYDVYYTVNVPVHEINITGTIDIDSYE